MGSVKEWQMEMDSEIADAIDHGATSLSEVIAYVRTMLHVIDEDYVKKQVEKIFVE